MTPPSAPRFKTALDLDTKPERWHPGPPFELLDLRPGRAVLLGAPPAVGKTTLTLQVVSGVLSNHPTLRAVVGNVEMSPAALVEKLLARLAGVPLDAIMNREMLAAERGRVDAALSDHASLLDRIAFLEPPFTVAHLTAAMIGFNARVAVLDYAQRFVGGDGADARLKLDDMMNAVRTLATAGAGVVLVSSVSRQKTKNGSSTYANVNMASFRGSAELEFGADAAYLLHADGNGLTNLEFPPPDPVAGREAEAEPGRCQAHRVSHLPRRAADARPATVARRGRRVVLAVDVRKEGAGAVYGPPGCGPVRRRSRDRGPLDRRAANRRVRPGGAGGSERANGVRGEGPSEAARRP